MAPPASATAIPQTPRPSDGDCIGLSLPGPDPRKAEPPVQGVAEKDEQKEDAFEDGDGGVGQIVRPLQHAAAGEKASHEESYASDDDQGVLNGVTVDDLNSDTRQQMNLPEHLKGALVTQVDPDSAAARAGVSAGDVILSINRHRVESAQQAVDLSAKAQNKKTLLRLWSHGSTLFVVVDESQPNSAS